MLLVMVSARLERWIRSTYAGISAEAVFRELVHLESQPDALDSQGQERLQAALAFAGNGDMDRFRYVIDLLRIDWRDVLVMGGLGDESWPDDLDRRLGPD
jgi:hypothetical protein